MDREVTLTSQGRIEELYLRHGPDALRLAFLLTGNIAMAEDIAQEAFARVIGRLRHIREPAAFGVYLRVAVTNLSRNHFRTMSRERRFVQRFGPLARQESVEPDVTGHGAVIQALMALPERQRTAVVLRFYEDLTDEQTAQVLRCRTGTVRSLISRGIASLRSTLKGELDAD
jgi:RNA polymerase sigma-70 factor (sigma-E family)